jgi:hypothetical protein
VLAIVGSLVVIGVAGTGGALFGISGEMATLTEKVAQHDKMADDVREARDVAKENGTELRHLRTDLARIDKENRAAYRRLLAELKKLNGS